MPETTSPGSAPDLDAALRPVVAALLPGWKVTSAWCDEASMPMPGALAVCTPTPTRQMAHFDVVQPWPSTESLSETLWHEAGHAWISPLTSLIPASDGAVMLEEQLIERLGVLLGTLSPLARRAVIGGINQYAQAPMRARITALAARARSGGPMDSNMIMEALEALIGGDAEKCQEILKGLIAAAAGGGSPPPAGEPDGDEARMEIPPGAPSGPNDDAPEAADIPGGKAMADPKKPAGPATPPESPRAAARLAALDHEHARARKAANATVGITVRARLREVRQDGVSLPTDLEAKLGAMTDLDAFEQRLGDILEGRKLASPGGARARTELRAVAGGHAATPPPADDAPTPEGEDTLKAEGFDLRFISHYRKTAASDPMGASIQLNAARARIRGGLVTRDRAARTVKS